MAVTTGRDRLVASTYTADLLRRLIAREEADLEDLRRRLEELEGGGGSNRRDRR
jgi:hypothetical protein